MKMIYGAWVVLTFGGFAGLLVNSDVTPGTAVGLNLQGVADGSDSGDGMVFEL